MLCYGLLVMFYCEAAQQSIPVDSFCSLYNPVYMSHADTRGTKEQTDKNNAKWTALCAEKQ